MSQTKPFEVAPQVPRERILCLNDAGIRRDGHYVLYWMVAYRRPAWNFALQRAAEWAAELDKPLLVFEALRSGYQWASDRLHAFVIRGMADNLRDFAETPAAYYPYLEPESGASSGQLEALAERACVIVSDDYPCFFLPTMQKYVSRKVRILLELVDSNGILPMRSAEKVYARAFDFRRFLQKTLHPHLEAFPMVEPLQEMDLPVLDDLPADVLKEWPAAKPEEIVEDVDRLNEFPIDHSVGVVPDAGGTQAARKRLEQFKTSGLPKYDEARNQPAQEVTSGLSAYLHFGHISTHHIFAELMRDAGWSPEDLAENAKGSSSDWWGVAPPLESFLDELLTWREVGFNMCWQRSDYDRYESLPDWARETLADHADDERPHRYCLEEFQESRTHDELWNAAQRQLVREGRIHNYLRMLWGKKILEWSASPQDALSVMIELNNRFALDGRDPNSYSGIFWVLGRYDRPWGPERPIFGKVRYMTSKNTAKKVDVEPYLERYAPDSESDGAE